jgi:hypothetical protein
MQKLFLVFASFGVAAGSFAVEPITALNAVKLLPKSQARNLARIEAYEGTPAPDRWHLLVHDPESESGVREFVVAGGEIVASRSVSQFAQKLSAEDVIGDDIVKLDSDRLAEIAEDYARANEITPAAMNYQLKKEGAEAAPLWKVTCLDSDGKAVGTLVVTAGKGMVISHPGFAMAPPSQSDADFMAEAFPTPAEEIEFEEAAPMERRKPRRRAKEPAGLFRRIGGSMQKFFTGKDTISR